MKRISHLLSIALFLATGTLCGNAQTPEGKEGLFYYSSDQKIYIEEVPGKLIVKKEPHVSKDEVEIIITSYLEEGAIDWFNEDACVIKTDIEIVDGVIDYLISRDEIISARHLYMSTVDIEYYKRHPSEELLSLGLTDQLVLKFKNGVEGSVQSDIINEYGLRLLKKNEIYEMYTVSKSENVLAVSNKLFETGLFSFVQPEWICKISFFDNNAFYPNDPYFQYQVTLHNTGQTFNGHSGYVDADIDAPEAWALTMGRDDIVVAVIDEGVTSNHPDLPNTRQVRLEGSNFGSGDPDDPSPTGNHGHGNACAGVIAATSNNGEGVAGIAPLCKIMPIRTDENTSLSDMADAILFAVNNGARVLSNSWGYNTQVNISSSLVNAITNATNSDNNCVVLFAAGNTAGHAGSDNGYVCFPANQSINGKLTVGASDRYDYQSDYSPSSSLIDIVAPSHRAHTYDGYAYPVIYGENMDMWSIDIPGNYGYNPWPLDQGTFFFEGETLPATGTNYLSYTGHFGGTSHACPVAAGVAALVLSMNPELTSQMVSAILKASADKVGGYTYVNGRCDEMGYGRVNAYNAVQMSCDTTFFVNTAVVGGSREVQGCDIYIKNSGVTNNGYLKVRAKNSVTIDGIFQIRSGSKLEIRHYSDY